MTLPVLGLLCAAAGLPGLAAATKLRMDALQEAQKPPPDLPAYILTADNQLCWQMGHSNQGYVRMSIRNGPLRDMIEGVKPGNGTCGGAGFPHFVTTLDP